MEWEEGSLKGIYRWANKIGPEDFGEIWYNCSVDLLFIRRVTHEFEFNGGICQLKERVDLSQDSENLFYIGDL